MVAALAAPLAARGVRVGVLIGHRLPVHRARPSSRGAIVPRFQEEAVALRPRRCCSRPARATRPACARRRSPTRSTTRSGGCCREGRAAEEVREALEVLNVGRLRDRGQGRRPRADSAGRGRARSSRSTPSEQWPRGHVHDRPGRRAPRPRHDDRRAAPRDLATAAPSLARRRRADACRDVEPAAGPPGRRRDRRHGCDPARARPTSRRSGRTSSTGRRDHRGPRRPLGLAALLRPRPQGAATRSTRSGAASSTRSRSTRSVTACRPSSCRRSSRSSCWPWRSSARRSSDAGYATGRSRASARGRPRRRRRRRRPGRWATRSARTCRCSLGDDGAGS